MYAISRLLPLLILALPALASAQGLSTTTLELNELWRRGGDEDEILLGNIDRVVLDPAGNAYALDAQLNEVLVFSPDGELLRTIGHEGEGPGEFRNPSDLFYGLGDRVGVLQAFPGRIIQLDPMGNPLDIFHLPELPGSAFQVVLRARASQDRLVLSGTRQQTEGQQRLQLQYLESFTPDGKLITSFHEETRPFVYGGMKYKEAGFVSFQRRWAAAPDGRVMAPLSFDDYRIHVWSADGTLERVIERADYEPLVRTRKQLKSTQTLYDAITSFNPRSSFEVSKTYPAIAQMFVLDNGELWVLSSRGIYDRPAGTAAVFDVFDRAGELVHETILIGDIDPEEDSMYLIGNRLYAVTDALGAALSAMNAQGEDDDVTGDVEPSNIVCFELVAVE